jgi:hypothetical protein
MAFLPLDYEAPQGGNYMKLQTGENRFRVLGEAIVGNVFWIVNHEGGRKPIRRRMNEVIHDDELETRDGKRERVKHFWAFPVWNVKAEQVQILEITQSTIQSAILALHDSPDWGDPKGYDLIVTKSGSGMDTEYNTMPGRACDISADVMRAYMDAGINMDALFSGGDPFNSGVGNNKAQPNDGPRTISYDEAVSECKAVGIIEDDLKEHLRAKGFTKHRTVEFTKAVEALIVEHTAVGAAVGEGGPHQAIDSDEIPFSPDAFDGQPWKS